ncbi:MAG TPA: F0F1 ATP synthase subunit gamma [Mycobacteriales bacterium]|nr:F0F1 ATP synthase subunit gamma [Mycobacteriales bacterium]
MGAQLRVYRRRIRSVQSTKKITRAMELIAASRIQKAQQRVAAARPYAEAITRVVTEAASYTRGEHPLTTPRESPGRAAVVVVTSDRGLAGAYNANALRAAEGLNELLRSEGKEPVPFLIGRKGLAFYRFRSRDTSRNWTGFSEQPGYADAKQVADRVIADFIAGSAEDGVDEIHLVYTEYVSALTQRTVAKRVLPLELEFSDEQSDGLSALVEFESSQEEVLDALLPRYVESRFYAALLDSAASESAARRRAMKAATDNADELIKSLTRAANSARQAEITQEIMEIVGGAEALSKTEGV